MGVEPTLVENTSSALSQNYFIFLFFCMSQKVELPSLTGHRTKTRKRDEKKIYDPTGFRDYLIEGLATAGTDLEQISKFLDTAGNKTDYDYRRYGEALLEILKAGDQVFIKLMRRYKYLEKMLADEMKKIFVYLRGFSEDHRYRLAEITALWVVSGLV